MSDDVRAATPATPSGRYRLKTHDLAPVLLPRPRAASLPSSLVRTERKEFNAVPPTGLRSSIVRGNPPYRGRALLESVAFDPFSGSESFKLLLQNLEASSKRREKPRAVMEFRLWLSQHFQQLVRTFRALGMINTETAKGNALVASIVNQCSDRIDENDEINCTEDDQEAAECEEAWRLIFRYATVLSATPGETIAVQRTTCSESVYFLLNGHCELSFRPLLLRETSISSTLPKIPIIGILGLCDGPVLHLRDLTAGDCFGLDAAAFGFEYQLSTATVGNARQRNLLGLRENALTHVLCLPYQLVQQLQRRHQDSIARVPAFPISFAPEAEGFLRNTFLFRSMADSSRRFLAAHLHVVAIEEQEYLFTPGQPVRVFLVISGQLTLGSPRHGTKQEADLELELLQAHDSVGVAETLRLATSFERYCAVTSAHGARAYALPSTVLLMVLAQESPSFKLFQEWITHRQAWFELRRATALAQRKKLTAEGSVHVVRLTLAAQRRSKLTCSRCGWAGHVSTSSSCVCVDIQVSDPAVPELDKRGRKPREGSRAARQHARRSESLRSSERSEPELPLTISPVSPTSPPRIPAHRRLQVNSIALRALQISRVSMVERLQPNDDTENQEEQYTDSKTALFKSKKDDAVRSCALTQSFQRLEAALQ
ncbi:hypothetical protein PC123_g2151 [Phytophthora cactorum]|nr:hypothetical protein PC123_g2151 [Phytophthora cactorum]